MSSPEVKPYSPRKQYWIYCVYIIAILLWIFIIVVFKLYNNNGAILLWIPFIVFMIGIFNVGDLDEEVEHNMFKATYLSIGLILAMPLLTWCSRDYYGDKRQFTMIIMLSLILTLLTLIDVWMGKRWLSIYKHLRSSFQTMSITLLIYALTIYFLNRPTSKGIGF